MKIVTSDQMRTLEQRAERAGTTTDVLMENAGLEVARSVRRVLGRVVGTHTLVLVGKGNNGGDGLVVARRLRSWGGHVAVCLAGGRPDGDPKLAPVLAQHTPIVTPGAQLRAALAAADIVVDAVLGTGRSRPIGGPLETLLRDVTAERSRRPALRLLAVDLPSGVDADTGAVDPACAGADITVVLGRPKVGLYRFPGAEVAGRVEIAGIGLPPGLDSDVPVDLVTRRWAASALPSRPLSGHKGTFGRALVVAGSRSYVGAAALAVGGAGRVGAGLVTLAAPVSLRATLAPLAVEATHLPLDEAAPGVHSPSASGQVLDEAAKCRALLVGPGIGQAPETGEMLRALLLSGEPFPPTVIDADGLNFLAQHDGWWDRLSGAAVLTPHPGEMARLTGRTTAEVQRDRIATAIEAAERWGCVVVLKGAHTVVAQSVRPVLGTLRQAQGERGERIGGSASVSPFANPALASAGTGDVLAGAIAGLLAQGLDPMDAAALGVYLHGAAAEVVARRSRRGRPSRNRHCHGNRRKATPIRHSRESGNPGRRGGTGLLASDLLPALPRAMAALAR